MSPEIHMSRSVEHLLPLSRQRIYLTVLVLAAELLHLAWEYWHGGVQRHHFLQRADMPAISNWWGLLLLPALTWFLSGRAQKRIASYAIPEGTPSKATTSVIAGFVGALIVGIALSVAFTTGQNDIASALFQGMLLIALLLPVYRAECLLGFVLAMTFTFGAVLPTMIGTIVAAISLVALMLSRRFIYPTLAYLWAWHKRK